MKTMPFLALPRSLPLLSLRCGKESTVAEKEGRVHERVVWDHTKVMFMCNIHSPNNDIVISVLHTPSNSVVLC